MGLADWWVSVSQDKSKHAACNNGEPWSGEQHWLSSLNCLSFIFDIDVALQLLAIISTKYIIVEKIMMREVSNFTLAVANSCKVEFQVLHTIQLFLPGSLMSCFMSHQCSGWDSPYSMSLPHELHAACINLVLRSAACINLVLWLCIMCQVGCSWSHLVYILA